MEVRQAKGSSEIESEIDWAIQRETGADSEVENRLVNNDQTRDYGELRDARDVEVYKAFAKEQVTRMSRGKRERPFKTFKEEMETVSGNAD